MKNDLIIRLSDKTKGILEKELAKIQYIPYEEKMVNRFLDLAADIVRAHLEPEIKAALRKMARDKSTYGAILVKNGPIDKELGRTPLDTMPPREKRTFVSESFLCGMSQLFGDIFGYTSEKNGHIVHNICPSINGGTKVSSEGAKIPFPYHVENLNLYPYTPSFLALYCLRSDKKKEAKTFALNPINVIKQLSRREIKILMAKDFFVGGNDSMGQGENARTIEMPILQKQGEVYEVTIEFKDTKAKNEKARRVLNKFKSLCNQSPDALSFDLECGDFLIIDNRRVLHSRTSFDADFDGYDRWLQRVYIHSNKLSWEWQSLIENNCIINDNKIG